MVVVDDERMSDAQYECIRDAFPLFAVSVENAASSVLDDNDISPDYWKGMMVGLANGLESSGQCGDAWRFTIEAMERAKERKRAKEVKA